MYTLHVSWFVLLCLVGVWSLGAGCREGVEESSKRKSEMATRSIEEVLKDHTDELMALPGVVGVAIGSEDDSTLCITVMIVKKTLQVESKIPNSLEGYPVVVEETGEIRALPERED